MSIAFNFFCLIVSFKIPNAVELSVRRGRWGLYVAQFSECDSEWGTTLGVVKTRSYFWFCCGGDHDFDDGSDIKDGAIQLILLWGFVAAEKQAS
jgi:hypothetical protein